LISFRYREAFVTELKISSMQESEPKKPRAKTIVNRKVGLLIDVYWRFQHQLGHITLRNVT